MENKHLTNLNNIVILNYLISERGKNERHFKRRGKTHT